jgi:hypothetical protein
MPPFAMDLHCLPQVMICMTPPAMAKRSAFFARRWLSKTPSTAAEPILVRALAIRMEILGDHADTAEVLDLMSLVRFANAGAVSAEGLQGDAARMRARLRE